METTPPPPVQPAVSSNDKSAAMQSQVSLGLFSSLKQEPVDDSEEEELIENKSLEEKSDDRKSKILKRNEPDPKMKRNRMGCFQSYIAVVKAYSTLNFLTLPIAFRCGGWLFSPIMLIIACFFELTCAVKLTKAAHKVKIYNYPDLVEYALGKTYCQIFVVFQALLNFVFTVGPLVFFMKTLYSFFRLVTGKEHDRAIYIPVLIVIFAPLTWIRTLETFKIGYVLAVSCIAYLVIVSSIIMLSDLTKNRDWEAGEGWEAFNFNGFITMWGMSFYMFEGVGCVLPVMEASTQKENFSSLVILALLSLLIMHINFSSLSYYYFGNKLKEPIVTE